MGKITAENMISPKLLRILRIALALLVFYSAVNRVVYSWNRDIPALYFFTVQTNLFVAIFWLLGSIWPRLRNNDVFYLVTTYISLTGIVFVLLLDAGFQQTIYSKLQANEITQIVHYYSMVCNVITHYIVPLLAVCDFLVFHRPEKLKHGWTMLIYPLAYFVFAIIYAQISGNYIYPFLDPGFVGGWLSVAFITIGLIFVITLIHRGLLALNRYIRKRIDAYYEALLNG